MIDKRTVFEIHRLKNSGLSNREIAATLHLDRTTVGKYLNNPTPSPAARKRKPSKLDPYKDAITAYLEAHPNIRAPVVLQQLKAKGFAGEITIVRAMLRELRGQSCQREPFFLLH